MSEQGFYRTILVPVDGSDTAARAADAARDLAAASGARVVVMSVAVDRDIMPSELMATGQVSRKDIMDDRRRQATEIADKAADSLKAAGVETRTEVAAGDPAHCIIEHSRTLDAPLVVIGRRGLTGFRELIMGSVSNKVVHYADCPVLVIN
ncbi:universal stress protein [Aquisalimonas asiatica]|uniref:Nucleotide-binding universal stress protein, UspA family n=1 Tax=Aquisalimonas asiatica TaxID=406100 RepID=A0A1H8VXP4_9GAMM|nr:universal stress protein [Aquisalimonas asiatica]SEP20110.1 Nucleotide-binding universal stress protein, UspA family [Aquisalimonas asiatica]